jgi:hypothetical protein
MFYALKSWLSSLTPTTQLQVYTALIATLVLVINLSTFIYNVNKERTKIKIEIKRDSDSSLATQYPLQEILLIQVINKSSNPVILNEVGIVAERKNYINFVDIIKIFSIFKPLEEEIMGSVEWIPLPGTLNPRSLGVVIIFFPQLEKTYKNIKEGNELSLEESEYLQKDKLVNAYEKLMKSYNASTKVLTVKPYTVTATGQRFTGKKTKIQLGNLMNL